MPQRFRKFGHVELPFVNEKGPANRACWLQAAMSRSASGGAGMIRSSQVIFSLRRCFSARRAVNLLAATPVVAEQSKAIKLRAAMIVTIAVYALAVGGSAFLNISAPILEGVPLWAGAALLLGFYTRAVFPRAVRLQCFVESVFLSAVLGEPRVKSSG